MALVFTGSLAKFHRELSHIPDLLAGTEHLESFRKTSQYRAWENSLLYISRELLMSKIKDDCGVLIEYKLPATSRRVDFIITGHDSAGTPGFVIIELKQWSEAKAVKDKPGVVVANTSGSHRGETNHPSYQAWSYRMFLDNMLDSVQKNHLHSVACACMHNYDYLGLHKDELAVDPNEELVAETPIFGKHDGQKLGSFVQKTVGGGNGEGIMQLLADGKVVPSKGLADAVCQMFDDVKSQAFTLIDEQKTAYETIMRAVRKDVKKQKRCVIISGGPGTGKSVVAVTALVNILREFVNDDAFEYSVSDIFINIAFFADNPKKDLIAKEMINCVEYIQSIQQWLVLKMSDFKISPQQTAGYIYKNGNLVERIPIVTTIKWPQEFKSIKAKRALFLATKKRLMTMTPTACEWLSSIKALAYFAEQLSKELHWSTVEYYDERKNETFISPFDSNSFIS